MMTTPQKTPQQLDLIAARERLGASALEITAWAMILVIGSATLFFLIVGPSEEHQKAITIYWLRMMVGGIMTVVALGVLWLLRRQHVKAAAVMLIAVLYLLLIGIALRLGLGVHSMSLPLLSLLILLTGFIISPRAGLGFTALAIATDLGLWLAQEAGWQVGLTPANLPPPLFVAIVYVVLFSLVGWLTARYSQLFTQGIIEGVVARQALATSELQLRTIVDNEPECVKLVAPDGIVLQMNRAGLAMVEADRPEQVTGQSVFSLIAPEYRDVFRAMHQSVIAGSAAALEFEVIGLRGGRRRLESHAVAMRDNDGQITAHLAVARDVTERYAHDQERVRQQESLKQAQEALEFSNQKLRERTAQAEAANLAKSQFLATMSHEIRTPLNGVLGMAQLLLMPDLDKHEQQEFARTILNSGNTLLALLNDILDLSKIEAGKVELAVAAFAPEQLVGEIAALMVENAASKGIALGAYWKGAPEAHYRGDPIRIRQMLSNLVSNAIKFSDHGQVLVEVREVSVDPATRVARLRFTVTDTGIGIAADKVDCLFQAFSQIDSSDTRRFGGTGLGLSIVRSLAERMGGEVGVSSEPGKGSRFWFEIPLEVVAAEADLRGEVRSSPAPNQATRSGAANSAAAARVLLVEDNALNRLVVLRLLEKFGYAVDIAENGQEALDRFTGADARPDIVLMDLQMPVMDGLEASRQIRRFEAETTGDRVPIIALTANAFDKDRENCTAAGMDDFMAKPVDANQLLLLLERWSQGRKVPAVESSQAVPDQLAAGGE
jgi:PAS domain S-box-containing protein